MEKIKQILEELRSDPKAAELVKNAAPKKPEELIKLLAGLAKEHGFDADEGEFAAYYVNALKERAEKSDAAAAAITAEPDRVLDAVAAGREDAPENDDCGGMFDVCKCGFMLAEKDNPDNKGCGWLYTYCEYGFTFI